MPDLLTLKLNYTRFRVSCAGWSSLVARQAHNLKVVGSNPTPATNDKNAKKNFLIIYLIIC